MDTLAAGVANSTSITWALFALGAMFSWGLGQGFTKKFINDVTGTKFCLYFVFAVAAVNITMWMKSGAPNPFLTNEGLFASEFVYWTIGAYICNGIAWAAYFVCIKYAPIAVVGTVCASYPAIMMVILYYWTGANPSALAWSGGMAVVLGCIVLGYTPKSAMDGDVDDSHVVGKIWVPLVIVAAVGWALCFSMGSYIGGAGLPGFDVNKQFVLMLIGNAIILVPFALIAGRKTDTHSFSGIRLAVIPMALFAFGDICMPQAFESEGADQFGGLIGAIGAAYPMVTLAFAFIVLKEKIIALHWGAIAVVISGIMLCTGAVEAVIAAM